MTPASATPRGGLLARALAAWVGAARRLAWLVVVAALAGAVASVLYARDELGMNTDTADMIARDLPWRQVYIDYKDAFPQYVDTLTVVVDGATPDLAERASRRLAERVGGEDTLVEWVRAPGADPFFERNALLYLEPDALDALVDHLAGVQPFIGTLVRDPGLAGLLGLLERASAAVADGESAIDLAPMLDAVAAAVAAQAEHRFHELSWSTLMLGREATRSDRRRFVIVKPRLDYGDLLPAGPVMERIRELARELELVPERGVRVRITGGTALAHEELESVTRGARLAGLLALVMVAVVLVAGLRSARLVVATLVTLIAGLTYTAAFATAAIGELNLISVAFAVLYIGLGVDYAIHYCLRWQELVREGLAPGPALERAAGDVGASLVLCAVTTGVGFFAFVPTDFAGVSELGLISGTGMFVSLAASVTLLPALLTVLPGRSPRPATASGAGRALAEVPYRHRRGVLGAAAAIGVASMAALPLARFDPNPLNLRDPQTESVAAYRDLLADSDQSPWEMVLLAHDAGEAAELAARLESSSAVAEAVRVVDLVPADQPDKLARIEELDLLLGLDLALAGERGEVDPDRARAALVDLDAALARLSAAGNAPPPARDAARRLRERLDALGVAYGGIAHVDAEALAGLADKLTAALPEQLRRLRAALGAAAFDLGDLPAHVRERWIAPDGRRRVEIRPAADLGDPAALERFVEAVAGIAPQATGPPLVNLYSGEAVVGAFLQAFASALALIAVLLAVLLRSARDAAMVMAPLLLAGAITVAAMVGFGIPFNFANVIALPLLLGIGVDNGVHIVHRVRSAPPATGNLLLTSTTRGVITSSLTTMCSFGNLAFSPHLGMASMGKVLTVGLAATLACTLLVVPALLAGRAGEAPR